MPARLVGIRRSYQEDGLVLEHLVFGACPLRLRELLSKLSRQVIPVGEEAR